MDDSLEEDAYIQRELQLERELLEDCERMVSVVRRVVARRQKGMSAPTYTGRNLVRLSTLCNMIVDIPDRVMFLLRCLTGPRLLEDCGLAQDMPPTEDMLYLAKKFAARFHISGEPQAWKRPPDLSDAPLHSLPEDYVMTQEDCKQLTALYSKLSAEDMDAIYQSMLCYIVSDSLRHAARGRIRELLREHNMHEFDQQALRHVYGAALALVPDVLPDINAQVLVGYKDLFSRYDKAPSDSEGEMSYADEEGD